MSNVAAAYFVGAVLLCAGLLGTFRPGPIAKYMKEVGGDSPAFGRLSEGLWIVGIRAAGVGAVFVSMLVLSVAAGAA